MTLRAFPPLEYDEIVWEGEVLVLLRMFGKIHPWSHLVQGVFFVVGSFLITVSISLGVICLFRFSDSSWFSFGRLYVSRNLSILPRFSNLLAYSLYYYFFYNHLYFLHVEKRDISCTIGELGDWCSHGRKHYGVYFKQLKIKLLMTQEFHFCEFMLGMLCNGTKGKKVH